MASNLKGWIGFLVVTIIIIGGAFGTSHILKTQTSGSSISSISAQNFNGYYDAANQTFVSNVTATSVSANFTITIASTSASGGMNISVIAPSIENLSAYNATYAVLYNKIYNDSVNRTINSGVTLNASINASLAANASKLAATYANQNLTYSLFPSFFKDVTFTAGKYVLNLTVQFNSTALGLMTTGQSLYAVINAAVGSDSTNGFILFTKT